VYPNLIGYDITFDVVDWNGDGGWDIIMGDYNGTKIKLFLGDPHAVDISPDLKGQVIARNFSWDMKSKIVTVRADFIKAQTVEFNLVTSQGKFIQKHRTEKMDPGNHTINFPLNAMASGVCFVQYCVNEKQFSNKIVISR